MAQATGMFKPWRHIMRRMREDDILSGLIIKDRWQLGLTAS
jgi:hypothetical protein